MRNAIERIVMRKFILKGVFSSSLLFGAAFSPTPAMACPPCAMDGVISAADVASKIATLAQMAASQASTLAGIAQATWTMLNGESGRTASLVAGREKEIAAEKELVQSELNYQAATEAQKRFALAKDTFTAPSAQPYRVCALLKAGQTAKTMSEDSRTFAKAFNVTSGRKSMYTENAGAAAKAVLDNYRENYCSKEDENRGRCTAVSDKRMHNAAVSADSLMNPIAGETFTPKEAAAAADFIQMVTNPTPQEKLPKGLDNKSIAAERFSLAQMTSQAQMSMANYSLAQILASKMPMGTTPDKAISTVGLMKKFVEERFGNPDYAKGISAMDSPGLLKEINSQMAVRNWINYQSYLQNERVEASLATQLAVAVKDKADQELSAARSLTSR